MEEFFILCNSLDVVEVEELLLSRYSNVEYILNLYFEEGLELIKKAFEREVEKRTWDRWLVDYQRMTKDDFVPFDEYLSKVMTYQSQPIIQISAEDLLTKAEQILEKVSQKIGE